MISDFLAEKKSNASTVFSNCRGDSINITACCFVIKFYLLILKLGHCYYFFKYSLAVSANNQSSLLSISNDEISFISNLITLLKSPIEYF